jgi:hypothetical protein
MRFPFQIGRGMRILLAPLRVTAANSFAEIDNSILRIRFGPLFDQSIPIAEVASVGRDVWPWYNGLGIKIGFRKRLGVLASTENIVKVSLRSPRKIPLVFGIGTNVEQLYLSLQDADGFLRALGF